MTFLRVAVSQRIDWISSRDEYRDSLDQRLVSFLLSCSLLPIPVPNTLSDVPKWCQAIRPQGVLLSGGNDIGEFPARDHTEKELLKIAKNERIPVLGICRGMQLMASASGSTLKSVSGHVKTRHELQGKRGHSVNSFHHFSIENCPKEFTVLATSEDQEIEAIRHLSLPWEGWMWHPERETPFSPIDQAHLKALFYDHTQ